MNGKEKTFIVESVAALLVLLSGAPARAGGGGGDALFSLDRNSPTLAAYGYSAADLFVDDPGYGPGTPLTIELRASGLGLGANANVVALSSGRDNGIPAILGAVGLYPNPMYLDEVRYQFSANRTAVDGVTGPVTIPFEGPISIEQSVPLFPDQFTNLDQAGDILDNTVNIDRFNFVMAVEEYLKLVGGPANPIDNLDALESMGSFGAVRLDTNGDLLPDVAVYYSVDALTGLSTSTIFVKPPGAAPRRTYATPAALGLAPDDDIDALSIWDVAPAGGPADLTFNPGDGVVFSLAEGSPSLPIVVGGVAIDEGGVFFAIPGPGIIAALPGGFFSLPVGDELDAIHVVDPRVNPLLPCLENSTGPSIVRPFEGLSVIQSQVDVEVGGPPVHAVVYLNETERLNDDRGVTEYSVTATSLDPGVAVIESASPSWCGWEPGFPSGVNHCTQCAPTLPSQPPYWSGPCPGATGTMSASWIRGFDNSQGPLTGPNTCLGDFHIRAVGPGWARIVFSAGAGYLGQPKTVAPAEMFLNVSASTSTVSLPDSRGPSQFALEIRPNPSVQQSEVDFVIPEPGGTVQLEIYDISGRRVRTLLAGHVDVGLHHVRWEGTDDSGEHLAPGLYLLRLRTPWGAATRKLVHVK